MDKPTCSDCQFFSRPGVPGSKYGVCVRYPVPVNHIEEHWCGEFKASQPVRLKEPAKVSTGTGRS